jgi:hypothetical protein
LPRPMVVATDSQQSMPGAIDSARWSPVVATANYLLSKLVQYAVIADC